MYMKIKIGDVLYKYEYKFMTYTVLDVVSHEATKAVYYTIECDACHHGGKCKVVVTKDDTDGYRYVKMLDELEDGDEKQYYWHNEGFYYTTKKECLTKGYRNKIAKNAEEINKLEKRIEELKDQNQKALDIIETL